MDKTDLASIVLADRPKRGAAAAPERAPIEPLRAGFDARSVLVLAIVVAVMAGVIGWSTTTIGQDQPLAAKRGQPAEQSTTRTAAAKATMVADEPAAPATPVAAAGIDLAPGRLVAARSGSGGGIVRVAIANQGRTALGADGTQLLFLLDGTVVGERTLGFIDGVSSATTELAFDSCPSGRHQLAVVVDPRGLVTEADERDNATTQSVSFGC